MTRKKAIWTADPIGAETSKNAIHLNESLKQIQSASSIQSASWTPPFSFSDTWKTPNYGNVDVSASARAEKQNGQCRIHNNTSKRNSSDDEKAERYLESYFGFGGTIRESGRLRVDVSAEIKAAMYDAFATDEFGISSLNMRMWQRIRTDIYLKKSEDESIQVFDKIEPIFPTFYWNLDGQDREHEDDEVNNRNLSYETITDNTFDVGSVVYIYVGIWTGLRLTADDYEFLIQNSSTVQINNVSAFIV